jgi:hypothetical protein
LRDSQLQLHLQQFTQIDIQNRNIYTLENELYIGRKGLGPMAIKFKKVTICFQTRKYIISKNFGEILTRHAGVYFPDNRHHFYISHTVFKHQFKKYHNFVYDENYANRVQLPSLRTCITYYDKFINQDPPITEDSTIEFILSALLNNADVIVLVICKTEVTSLLFKTNISSRYVDDKLDQQFNMKYH